MRNNLFPRRRKCLQILEQGKYFRKAIISPDSQCPLYRFCVRHWKQKELDTTQRLSNNRKYSSESEQQNTYCLKGCQGFSGSTIVKNSSANAGDKFGPWVGRIPWRRKWRLPPVYACLRESREPRSLGTIDNLGFLVGQFSPCKSYFILTHDPSQAGLAGLLTPSHCPTMCCGFPIPCPYFYKSFGLPS